MKTFLTGIRPSGKLHIGNYFGTVAQLLEMQDGSDKGTAMIVDYHALNTIQDPKVLHNNIEELVIEYLAVGLDPKKMTIFKQSDVSEHTELAWIFNCIVTVPFMMRAHAYKDAVETGKEVNMGVLDYPALMAADILLYEPDFVPVGKDQKQHVEYARDIAEKFNHIYGETFKLPEVRIKEEVMTLPGTDGRKMSKSYGNTLELFATDKEIEKAVMTIPTDSKGVDEPKSKEDNLLYEYHKLFTKGDDMAKVEEGIEKGGMGYADSKKILIKHIAEFIGPLRERREEVLKDKDMIKSVLEDGAKKAKEVASKKLAEVKKKIGVTI